MPHHIDLFNGTKIQKLKIEFWKDTARIGPQGNRLSETGKFDLTSTKKSVPVDKYVYIDIIVSKADEYEAVERYGEKDLGLTFELKYLKGTVCKDFGIISSEVKLCEKDYASHRRYSFKIEEIQSCSGGGDQQHHIDGNIGHPGGGG